VAQKLIIINLSVSRITTRKPSEIFSSNISVKEATEYCKLSLNILHIKEKGKEADYSAYRQYNSTTKRSDVDHTELPANTPHLPFFNVICAICW